MVRKHLKIDFTLYTFPADVANDVLRIESIGNAFGVSIEYIKSGNEKKKN